MDRGAWQATVQGPQRVGRDSKRLNTQEMRFPALRQEDSLEEGMATHSSILAWKIPWTEDPGRL